jgi:hypothetical protein
MMPTTSQRFEELILGFREACIRDAAAEVEDVCTRRVKHERTLDQFRSAVAVWRFSQELTADDFDILGVMQVTGRETLHSGVLAWLLAPDLTGLGTHAQGNRGFKLFLAMMHLPMEYADMPYWVRTEERGEDSIIDIEVASRGNFIIHIENKVWSSEGDSQTTREWEDIKRRAKYLNVPNDKRHALFLTPEGDRPTNPHFHPITWAQVAGVFDRFSDEAKPPDVKMFCRHYARAVRRSILEIEDHEEVSDGEATVQRGREVRDPDVRGRTTPGGDA